MLKRMLLGNESVDLDVPTKYVLKVLASGFVLGLVTKLVWDEYVEHQTQKWNEELEQELLEADK